MNGYLNYAYSLLKQKLKMMLKHFFDNNLNYWFLFKRPKEIPEYKETVTLNARMSIPDLQPFKASFVWSSMNYRYSCFCFFKLFIFICGFSAKVTCTILAYKKQWRDYQNHFSSQENDDVFHIFDSFKFTVVNRALPTLHVGSLEIMFTLYSPFKWYKNQIYYMFMFIYLPTAAN